MKQMKSFFLITLMLVSLFTTFFIVHDVEAAPVGQHEDADGTARGWITADTYGGSTSTITLRPEGTGFYTQNTPVGDSPNYACVDETSQDSDSTYVRCYLYPSTGGKTDLYEVPDCTISGEIVSVTVYAYVRSEASAQEVLLYTYTHSDVYHTGIIGVGTSYSLKTGIFSTNPATGDPWTWDEVNDMQIGFRLRVGVSNEGVRCTQCYAVVEYHDTGFTVTRDTESSYETDNFTVTTDMTYTTDVTVVVPVSTEIDGISYVENESDSGRATEVNSYAELSLNTYYYSSSENLVYIRIDDLSNPETETWTISCNKSINFYLDVPQYLEVGEYFMSRGLITDSDDNPIDGVIAKTYLKYQNETVAYGPVAWHCSDGNYQCTFSTTSLIPNTYGVEIYFYHLATDTTYKEGYTLYLGVDPPGDVHVTATLHFSFYNNETGLGLGFETFKLYVSNSYPLEDEDRVFQPDYRTYTGQTLYYKVLDYFGNKIYPKTGTNQSVTVSSVSQGENIPIDWYTLSVKNMNHSIVEFTLTNGSRSQGAYLFPYEPFYFSVSEGIYDITMDYYNAATGAFEETKTENDFSITGDTYYWIQGYDLRDIVIQILAVNTSMDNLFINLNVDIDLVNSNITTLNSVINQIWNTQNSSFGTVNTILTSMWTSQNSSFQNVNDNILVFWDNTNSSFQNVTTSIFNVWNNQNVSFEHVESIMLQMWNNDNTTFNTLDNVIHQFWNNQNTSFQDVNNVILQFWNNQNTSFQDITNTLSSIWNSENTSFGDVQISIANMWFSQNDSFDTVNNNMILFWDSQNDSFQNVTNTLSQIWYTQNTSFGDTNSVLFQIWNVQNTTFDYVENTLTQMWFNQNSSFETVDNYFVQLWSNQNSSFENVTTYMSNMWLNMNSSFQNVHTELSGLWFSVNSSFTNVDQSIISIWDNQNSSFENVTQTLANIWNNQNSSFQDVTSVVLSVWNAQNSSFDSLNTFINTQFQFANNNINVSFIGVNSKLNVIHNDINVSFIYNNNLINFSYNKIINNITEMNITLYNRLMQILDDVSVAGDSVFNKTLDILDNISDIDINISDELFSKTLQIINHVTNESTTNMLLILETLNRLGNITNNTIADIVTDILDQLLNATFNYTANMTLVIDAIDGAISQIQNTRSVLYTTLTGLRNYIAQQTNPDVRVILRNPPMVFSTFDPIGQMLGQNFYKICPPINVIAQTRYHQIGTHMNSAPRVPTNGTSENGTITIVEDIIYFSIYGGTIPAWVRITYTDNGTLIQNESWIPNKFYADGYNITITTPSNIKIDRETRFSQIKKFDWDYYPGTDNLGWITENNGKKRTGYLRAGLEIENTMNTTWYDVYVYAGLAPDIEADPSTIRITDVENGEIILEEGENYKTGSNDIEFRLQDPLTTGDKANYLAEYYQAYANNYYYGNAVIRIDGYEINKRHDEKLYNYFKYTWINTNEKTYRGPLSFYFDFPVETGIKQDDVLVYDSGEQQNITEFIISDQFLQISTDAVGDVASSGGKTYEVYFKFETYPGTNVEDMHLDTVIAKPGGVPVSMTIIFIFIGLFLMALGILMVVLERTSKKQKELGKGIAAFGLLITAVIYILSNMGV